MGIIGSILTLAFVIIVVVLGGYLAIERVQEDIKEVKDYCSDKEGMQNYSKSIINCTAWNNNEIVLLGEWVIQ